MSQQDIVRAWKDANFRSSLSEDQLNQLPQNPAGINEMSDESLESIVGGRGGNGTGTGCGTGGNCTNCAPCSGKLF